MLQTSFTPYQLRTFAVRLGAPPAQIDSVASQPVALQYDLAAASENDTKSTGGFNEKGDALPAEMLPTDLTFNGVDFDLAPAGAGKPNAVVAKGQMIELPTGDYNRIYILAASVVGDRRAVFHVGKEPVEITVQDWGGFIGQWDTRLWKPRPDWVMVGKNHPRRVALRKDWAVSANHATWDLADRGSPTWSPSYPEDYLGLRPGYIKRASLAWYTDHNHTPDGLNQPYAYSYLFAYAMKLSPHTRTLTLPVDEKIRILAISVAREGPIVIPAQPLYDTLVEDTPE